MTAAVPPPAARKQPPSIDDILKAKRDKEAAAAKPKFIPKAERERIALEKRKKEVEEAQKRREASNGDSDVWRHSQEHNRTNGHASYNGHNGSSSSVPTGPRSMRDAPTGPSSMRNDRRNGDMAPPPPPDKKGNKRPAEDAEALIRQRYMGAEQNQSTFSAKKKRKRAALEANPHAKDEREQRVFGFRYFPTEKARARAEKQLSDNEVS